MKVTQKFLLLSALFTIIACTGADTSVQTSGEPVTIELIIENPIERYEEAVEPSQAPVEAPEGTAARPKAPLVRRTSTSTVGLPRESRISLPVTASISLMVVDLTGTEVNREPVGRSLSLLIYRPASEGVCRTPR